MPITKKTPIGKVEKDFQKSDAPQFEGKSKAKPAEMGVAAALNAKRKLKEGELEIVYAVKKPYAGCELTDLVKQIDPLVGLGGHSIVPDEIHSVYSDEDVANTTAQELHGEYEKGVEALEEKKGTVATKISKTIDSLEKKRKTQVDMAKENPKNAREHKDEIANIATKIDRLMDQLAKIENSKKEAKKEDKDKK